MNFLLSSTTRRKPAGQQGDPDPTGASSSAGGVREKRRKRAEAGGSEGLLYARDLGSSVRVGASMQAQHSVPALEEIPVYQFTAPVLDFVVTIGGCGYTF